MCKQTAYFNSWQQQQQKIMFLTFTKNVLWISLKNTFLDAGPKEEKSSLKIKSKNPQICKNLKKKVFSKQALKNSNFKCFVYEKP